MPILTLQQINESLSPLLTLDVPGVPYFSGLMQLLHSTGARPADIMPPGAITKNASGNFFLNPLKGNNQRSINPQGLTDSQIIQIENNQPIFNPFSVRRFRYHFSANYKYPLASVGEKQIALYIFRHAFIKNLVAEGLTSIEISEIMGYTTTTPVQFYSESEITVPELIL